MRCLPCLCLFHLHMAAQVSHLLDAEAVSSRKLQVVWHTFTRKHHGATSRGCPLRPHPTDSLLPVYLHPCFVFLLLHALQEDPGRCVPSLATWNVRKYCVWRLRQKQGDGGGRCPARGGAVCESLPEEGAQCVRAVTLCFSRTSVKLFKCKVRWHGSQPGWLVSQFLLWECTTDYFKKRSPHRFAGQVSKRTVDNESSEELRV